MPTYEQLLSDDPAWPELEAAARRSGRVTILPAERRAARACLEQLQVTTHSPLRHAGDVVVAGTPCHAPDVTRLVIAMLALMGCKGDDRMTTPVTNVGGTAAAPSPIPPGWIELDHQGRDEGAGQRADAAVRAAE